MAKPFTLLKPITFQGKEIKEISLDLAALTGMDMIAAEREFIRSMPDNERVALKELSKEYQTLVAARASNMPVEFFDQLGLKDFSRVTIGVQRFLLESELEIEEAK